MLFLTLDVDAVEAPSIGDCCFTNQARGGLLHQTGVFFSPPFWGLRITSLVQTETEREKKKKQMLGLELSGLIG